MKLTDQIIALLNACFSRCRRGAHVAILAGRGTAAQVQLFESGVTLQQLPGFLEREYVPWVVRDQRAIPATRHADGSPVDLGAAFVEIALPQVFADGAWGVSPGDYQAAWARLDAFPMVPTAVVDTERSLVALWALERPMPLDTPQGEKAADTLLEALARTLGGRTEPVAETRPSVSSGAGSDLLPAWSPRRPLLWLPGCTNSETGARPVVTLETFHDRRVDLADLRRAVGLDSTTSKRTARKDSAA